MKNTCRKNKLCNFRLPAALALSLAAGIAYATALAYFSADGVYIAVPAIIATAVLIVLTAKYRRLSLTVSLALAIAFFLVGAMYAYFYYCSFTSAEVTLGKTCLIEGTVSAVGRTSGGKDYIIVSSATAGGTRLNGKIIAYLQEKAGDYCEVGYKVSFLASLDKQSFFEGGEVGYRAQSGIKYYCAVYGGMDSTWQFSLFAVVNNAIRNALFNHTDGETAAVCFAMLTGDSSLMSEGTLATFRNGGIAHVFAVSGLHIGVVFGALTALFKRLPVNRYVSAALRVGIIFFYAGVCGFTPSSVRASVACAVAVAASLCYKKYDALNAIFSAAIILLLINPLYLYGVGFLLSFGAALGIVTLGRNLNRILAFVPKKLREALSVCISVNVLTIPTQLLYFGYTSWAGFVLNIIIIPVVSVLYLLLFACAILSAALPFAAVALVPVSTAPIQFLMNIFVECGFENAVFTHYTGSWIYLPFALLGAGITDKLNLKLFWRGALSSFSVIWLIISFAAAGEMASGVVRVTFGAGNSGGSAVINTGEGTVIVLSENFSGEVEGYTGNAVAAVYAGGAEGVSVYYALDYGCGEMYVAGGTVGVDGVFSVKIISADKFSLCGVDFTFASSGLSIEIDGVTLSLCECLPDGQAEDLLFYCPESGAGTLYCGDKSYAPETCGGVVFEIRRGNLSLISVKAK